MIKTTQQPRSTTQNLRIAARIWSLVSIGFILLIFFGEGFSQGFDVASITSREWVLFACFPVGLLVGLILAWWREGIGGAIAIVSFLTFYLVDFLDDGSFPRGPWFALLAVPGLLFLICWLTAREGDRP